MESNLIASTPLPQNFTTDRLIRKETYDNVLAFLAQNPSVVLRVYSPTNVTNAPHTDQDCIWDSRVDGPLPEL